MKFASHLRRSARLLISGLTVASAGLGSIAKAQVSYTGVPYSQNFDSLANTGTTNPFSNDSTLPGWFVASGDGGYSGTGDFTFAFPATPAGFTTYRASTGSDTAGALYSFGSSGSTDRAFGALPTNGLNEIYFGLALKNDTGASVASVSLSYDGEQWRRAGQQSPFPQHVETLTFFYRVGGSALDGTGAWVAVPTANFISPNAALAEAATLDGNLAENKASLSVTIPVTLAAGQNIWFLWVDVNDTGSDHGMTIDNLNISLQSAAAGFPVISSETTATATANSPFSYTIVASNSPTSYSASPLPPGLSLSAGGVISGTPTTPGNYSITLSATNGSGSGQATLALTVNIDPNAPVIGAGQVVNAVLNTAISSYQIIASNSPTSYSSGALPAGLVLDPATGIISGTPTVAGSFTVSVSVTNTSGVGVANISIVVNSAPIITSELSASTYVNQPFSYTLVIDEQEAYPTTAVVWTGLPDGVSSLSAKSITGTPVSTGTYSISITARNDLNGSSSTNVTLTLKVIDQATQDSIPSSVVINKFVNGTPDKVELLVVGNGAPGSTVDMRGMILKDFSGSIVSDNGGKYVFAASSLWSAVPAGTLIVLSNGTSETEDLIAADYLLRVNLGDTAYFSSVSAFDIATTEMVMIKAAGYGTLGVAGGIHALASGVSDPLPADTALLSLYRAFTGKKLSATTTTGTNIGIFAKNSTSALVDFIGTASSFTSLDATGNVALASLSFGAANNSTNQTYITSLRAVALTGVQAWRQTNFGTTANTGTTADTADYDNDGIPNLIEYATGTNPAVATANPVVTGQSGNFLTLTFPRISDASLTYKVLASGDLTTGFAETSPALINTVGSTSTYTDNVSLATPGVRRFLRLQVTY